ncbi:MAG: RNA polymerase sigma factor [Lapillicoccus sp.]
MRRIDGDTVGDERTAPDLVGDIRAGSARAMGELFDRHADAIYSYCFRRCADWARAEDLCSTVFLEAWRHRSRFVVHDGSALPWLYGVATNVCRNDARSHRRHNRALARVPLESSFPDHAEEVAHRLDDEAMMRALLERVADLAPRDRDVLALVVWEGLAYPAVALALGIPVGTVKSRMSRVRRLLALPDPALPTHPAHPQDLT